MNENPQNTEAVGTEPEPASVAFDENQEHATESQAERSADRVHDDGLRDIKEQITAAESLLRQANERATAQLKDLRQLWRDGLIKSKEDFAALSAEIIASIEVATTIVSERSTDYRLKRIELLAADTQPDALRERVAALRIPDRLEELKQVNVQAGGSNARGVFELSNDNLVLIQKSAGAYEFNGAMPYLMQAVGNERIPRVVEVFRSGDATYQVMEKAAGVQVNTIPVEQIANISQAHFDQFVDDVRVLNEHGLRIDPSKTSNLFYDAQKGFVFIDLTDAQAAHLGADVPNQITVDALRSAVIGSSDNPLVISKIQQAIERR